MEKLIIEHSIDGVYFYRESLDHHKKTEIERERERSLRRITLEDLDDECLVSEGEYLVIDLPSERKKKSSRKKGGKK